MVSRSWAVNEWPADIFPNNAKRGEYLVRSHKDSLVKARAIARVGRALVVDGDRYQRWLNSKVDEVLTYRPNGAAARSKKVKR